MSADEIVEPYGYSPWWFWLGLALVVVVVAWWVVLFLVHRRRQVVPAAPAPRAPVVVAHGGGDPWADARARALAAIDALAGRYGAGSADPRTVHQELATVVRDFASDRAGIDARTLTLHELRAHPALEPAVGVVAQLYAPEFATGAAAAVSPEHTLQQARAVVAGW